MSEDDIGAKVNIGQLVSVEIFNPDKIPLDDPKVNKFTK